MENETTEESDTGKIINRKKRNKAGKRPKKRTKMIMKIDGARKLIMDTGSMVTKTAPDKKNKQNESVPRNANFLEVIRK